MDVLVIVPLGSQQHLPLRVQNVWPEMKQALSRHGWENYSFLCVETDYSSDTSRQKSRSPNR